jgi:hypothetical protein
MDDCHLGYITKLRGKKKNDTTLIHTMVRFHLVIVISLVWNDYLL